MGVPLPRPAALAARLETPIAEWDYLDEAFLQETRSRKVCITCHWFRHHARAGPMTFNAIQRAAGRLRLSLR